MAWKCDLCGKKPTSGNRVSHANNKTRRRWMPNLQKFKTTVNGTVTSMRLCTRCIRSQKLVKVVTPARGVKKSAAWAEKTPSQPQT